MLATRFVHFAREAAWWPYSPTRPTTPHRPLTPRHFLEKATTSRYSTVSTYLRSSSGLRYNEPSYKLRDYIQLSVYGSHCSIALDEHSTTSKF